MERTVEERRRAVMKMALAGVEEVYVVTSTHPNESATEVRSVHLTIEGAEGAMNTLNDDENEDGQLEVSILTVNLEE